MSLFDRLFNTDKGKQNLPRKTEKHDDDFDETSDAFLDRIGEFALQARAQQSPAYTQPVDLQDISISAYEEPLIPDSTQSKIAELRSIIQHIESSAPRTTEIVLTKQYKIDYKKDLNPAQL